MKHKYADVIKIWADGGLIQYRRIPNFNKESDWKNWEWSFANQTPPWEDCSYEWRIKLPNRGLIYKIALMKTLKGDLYVCGAYNPETQEIVLGDFGDDYISWKWVSDWVTTELIE